MAHSEVIKKTGVKLLKKKKILISVAVLLIICAVIFDFGFLRRGSASNDLLTAKVDRGDIRNTVSATGTVQAVTTVQVGAQVSGQVQALYADYNSVVHAGQVVAKLDPANFEAQVQRAQADVNNAQAGIKSAQASFANAQAGLQSAQANAKALRVAQDDALDVLNRNKELLNSGVISTRDMEVAKTAYDSAVAKSKQAEAQIGQAQAQVGVAQAAVAAAQAQLQQNEAALKQAQVSLDYTVIKTPIDGVVVSRNVDVGQTVAASLQAPTLFTIANDLRQMQVVANIDEADIGKISNNTDVRFTVDAFPSQQFKGTISEIRLNSQTAQNVVTYNVIISVDNSGLKLKPGMTANITLGVGEADNALRVPNSALRYRPQGDALSRVEQGSGGSATQGSANADGSRRNRMANIDTTGLSPQGAEIVKKMSDPSITSDQRKALMQQLSDDDKQKIRAQMGGGSHKGDQGNQNANGASDANKPGDQKEIAGVPVQKGTVASGIDPEAAEKIQFPNPQVEKDKSAVVWVLNKDNKLVQKNIVIGLTDGQYTQVVSGDLKDGDVVVIGQTVTASSKPSTPSNPLAGGGRGAGGGGFRGR
ncbi:MAG TPA: efflux RND transporter periplasmic adaptor subunit [Blastocatellia bacterium]|nr:efflux RND transporter periplasmic adaptor subunit [Blastocatellia bacterium]